MAIGRFGKKALVDLIELVWTPKTTWRLEFFK